MNFTVLLTDDAIRDLGNIDDYISEHDSSQNADYVLSKIEEALFKLAEQSDRGAYLRELSTLGIREF